MGLEQKHIEKEDVIFDKLLSLIYVQAKIYLKMSILNFFESRGSINYFPSNDSSFFTPIDNDHFNKNCIVSDNQSQNCPPSLHGLNFPHFRRTQNQCKK